MDKKAVLKALSTFRKALETRGLRIDKIILYGSYAQNTYKEGSDIDIIVISEDFNSKNYWERIDILSEAIYEVFEPIEAIALTPEEWEKGTSDIVEYSKSGEVVYSA
ncbi:MAG: nucleotidyltransferase domain-containing protein [Thermodesulfobacteriota bacterium]